jgi:ABC-type glycerol-3-phosphate transport system substrate-binding protein
MRKKRLLTMSTALVFLLLPAAFAVSRAGSDPKLIEAAKSEGKVVFYTTMTLSQSEKVVEKFETKYPFIKVGLFRTGGDPLLNKIQIEARGGLYAWDVVSGRGEMVLPLMEDKLLAPYRSPETKLISQDLLDDQSYWTAYYVNPTS